ncbi:transcription factor S-II-domain-containing protein [Chytriomyces sp. MP71]|nr:transcription factor S-II-domain-containing protein [Chytriomyces sp. MP71]
MSRKAQQKHSLLFCPDCGSLLDPPTGTETSVQCTLCACILPAEAFDALEVVTASGAHAFTERPAPKRRDENGDEDTVAHLRDGATIKERCPKCDAPEMVFHTAQLRSADEGQTIFYSCVKCGFKEKLNS